MPKDPKEKSTQLERPAELVDVTVGLEYVSPETADTWLKSSPEHNRGLTKRVAFRYESAMVENRWFFTGEPIIFNGTQIEDGWHRLTALVASGKGQWLVVVRGVPANAFHYIDHGKGRVFRDTLEFLSVSHSSILASAVSHLTGYFTHARFTSLALEDHQRWATYQEHGDKLKELVEQRYQKRPPIAVPPGVLTAVHFVLAQKDTDAADEFMEMVLLGDDLESDHPISQFRAIVRKIAAMEPGRKPSGLPIRFGAGLIRAWNLVRNNETVTKFVLPSTTPEPV